MELGRGSADVPELLAALEEFDYRGWVTVERRNSPRPAEESPTRLSICDRCDGLASYGDVVR